MQLEIPQSMREEHEEIHGALVTATEVPGPVGEAARELADILHPHFVREEQIALPPLSLLEPLAQGTFAPWMRDVLPMTDSLAAELDVERLARELQAHARAEEELFYPAAILVGEIVRGRSQ